MFYCIAWSIHEFVKSLHAKHSDRLDQFSVTLKLRATDGKHYNTTIYTRKGIMEICRHSGQPKADRFMDWAWDVLDSLISGKNKIIPARRTLGEVNSAARIITQTLKEAGMSPQFRAVAIKSLYASIGVEIPLQGVTVDKCTYDATAIAKKLGVFSKADKPHIQAVSAIISTVGADDSEKEVVPFQNQANGHSGTNIQYAESVVERVAGWLQRNNYPPEILFNSKSYKVNYHN